MYVDLEPCRFQTWLAIVVKAGKVVNWLLWATTTLLNDKALHEETIYVPLKSFTALFETWFAGMCARPDLAVAHNEVDTNKALPSLLGSRNGTRLRA